jgi:hypothetical protein
MKKILSSIVLCLVLLACHREKKEFLGPGYISAPEGFAVQSFTASAPNADFTTGTIKFNADFTHTVTWVLTIRGQKSRAVHEVRGVSSQLNDLEWTGVHDALFFFRKDETVIATLSFLGTTLTSEVSVKIDKAADYKTCGTFPRYGDFEDTMRIRFPNWEKFNIVEHGIDSMAVDYKGNIVPSVEGKRYYYIKGLGTQQVFVDGLRYIGQFNPALPQDADQVWVNIYIYGTGDPNGLIELEYQEADFDGSLSGYQGNDDDAFVAQVPLEHKGWKLFSFKYSSLSPSLNAEFGGSGNKIHEPHNLKAFNVILLKKTNPNAPVEVYFDYPIITVGGPFKPCK